MIEFPAVSFKRMVPEPPAGIAGGAVGSSARNLSRHYRDVRHRLMNPLPFLSMSTRCISWTWGLPTINPTRTTVAHIAQATSRHYGVTVLDIYGEFRDATIVLPRHVVMYLAREMSGYSFPRIAQALERDHTTIMHAYRKIKARLKSDKKLRADIEAIKQRMAFV